jgi:hypothetical protein
MLKFKSKLIIAVVVIFGITAFISCEKENSPEEKKDIEINVDFTEFGKYHNEILDEFYKAKRVKSTFSFEEKVDLVDNYLSEVVDSINPGDFTKIIENQVKQKEYLNKITDSNSDISTGFEIIDDLFTNNQISKVESEYFKAIISAYEEFPFQFSQLLTKIIEIENSVIDDVYISDKEKKNLLSVLNITKSSVEYWNTGLVHKTKKEYK